MDKTQDSEKQVSSKHFKFALGDRVRIKVSGENGEVVARAEYANAEDTYRIRYQSADGQATERWWTEAAIANVN